MRALAGASQPTHQAAILRLGHRQMLLPDELHQHQAAWSLTNCIWQDLTDALRKTIMKAVA